MRRLSLLILLLSISGCETLGRWTDNSMAWADRTLPTYDDWFGDEPKPQESYTQRPAYPTEPVQVVHTAPTAPVTVASPAPISTQQEVYYDNSERGHSFGR